MSETPQRRQRSGVARMWIVLAVLLASGVALMAGTVYALVAASSSNAERSPGSGPETPSVSPETSRQPGEARDGAEDELAARPMMDLPLSAARPQPIVNATAGPAMVLPRPGQEKEVVPTGFPHTPLGALAQLAAIDETAWRNATPDQAERVYHWASMPGAVPMREWTPYVGVESLLGSAGQPSATVLQSSFTPTHAQIKGVLDGGDFVVACVLGEFVATVQATGKAGVGDCQRMVWTSHGWRIGPGKQPAYAPSAWPGSADCVRAGWRSIAYA